MEKNGTPTVRAAASLALGAARLTIKPQTTTARTPDASTDSARRYAANGVSSARTLLSIGSFRRRRMYRAGKAMSAPAAAPPT